MKEHAFRLHDGKRGSALAVRVTPRAGRNELAGILADGTLKVRLSAPPEEGRANAALIKLLAEVLEVPAGRLEIVAGVTGKDKLVTVLELDSAAVSQRILKALKKA
jgi:hypothetical protein